MDAVVALTRTAGTAIAFGGLWVQFVAYDDTPATAAGILSVVLIIMRVVAMCLRYTDFSVALLVLAYSIMLKIPESAGSYVALGGLYVSGLGEALELRRMPFEPL